MRLQILDCRMQIEERHKVQGVGHEEESTARFLTTPVGASSACVKRICELRDFGFVRAWSMGR